jgi:bacillithiol biosynthesis cysteine-adding enzyme BshC
VRLEALPPEVGPPAGALADALRAGTPVPAAALAPLPRTDAGWLPAIEEAARTPLSVRTRAALLALQGSVEGGPRALANAAALFESGAACVVTGQQPGLLGGPLLTLHKAAGAVRLAQRLDGLGGHRVVPVFWLASEDHDLDEANQVTLIDRLGQARRGALPIEADGRSLSDVEIPKGASDGLTDEIAQWLPPTDRAREVLAAVGRRADEGFALWCARALLAYLGDSGLVLLDPVVLRPFTGPLLADLALRGRALGREMAEATGPLAAAGLPTPLTPRPDALPLFLRERPQGRRLRVSVDASGAVTGPEGQAFGSLEEVASAVAADPRLGSGDVVGRVLLQNALLPVVAYLAGPTELAYHAQIRPAARALGHRFPLVVPRPQATWIDGRAEEALAAFGLDAVGALQREPGAGPPEARRAHAEDEELERIGRWLLEPPTSRLARGGGRGPEALRRTLERLRAQWARARPDIEAAFAADRSMDAGRWKRAEEQIWPRGRVQERTLSTLSIAARHGLRTVALAAEGLDPLA